MKISGVDNELPTFNARQLVAVLWGQIEDNVRERPVKEQLIAVLDAIDTHLKTIEAAIDQPAADAGVRQ